MASNVGAGLTTTTSLDDYDDFEERFVDPFEITSSCVFVVLGALTICIYYRIARAHARQGFRTHFQRIFFVLITNDIFTFLFQLFDVRLPTWGVHEWYLDLREGLWPTILNYGATVTLMVQSFGTLLIAVNRFTSLVMPLRFIVLVSKETRETVLGKRDDTISGGKAHSKIAVSRILSINPTQNGPPVVSTITFMGRNTVHVA
ncbi:unnamed protein product, partial [Mesorhabditis spiculigera]